MKKQKVLSALIVVCLMMNILSSLGSFATTEEITQNTDQAVLETDESITADSENIALAANEVIGYTNQYTYIRMAPYWTSEVVDTIASGVKINIIDREFTYLYVRYDNAGTKTGYIPLANTNATGYSWCSYNKYHRAYNSTSSAQNVYYGPSTSTYASCGSIDADEGEVSNKPMIVLKTEGNYAFIQYCTNTSNTGSENVKFKRAWIPLNRITIVTPTSVTKSDYYYIKNAATGMYLDLESYSAGNYDGGNIHIWEFHGGYNQEWLLEPQVSNGATYTKISTNQGTQKRVLRVKESTAVVGNNIELYTKSDPSKDQEFLIESAGSGKYYIRARCGNLYLTLGVKPSESGIGGDVYLTFPSNNDYNKWILEPAYKINTDYIHTGSYIANTDPNYKNGIEAVYNIYNVPNEVEYNGMDLLLHQYTQSGITLWNKPNKKISASYDVIQNTQPADLINIDTEVSFLELEDGEYGLGKTHYVSANDRVTITIYYKAIFDYLTNPYSNRTLNDFDDVWKFVVAHEIGHSLGLGDLKQTGSSSSIMSYSHSITNSSAPQKMDFAGVKKVYAKKEF
ncbi:MAG: RICIN domain-containing protein [Clostridia bacterium]|nr:RICIN domain-containing protein [Clostridia bacterium]